MVSYRRDAVVVSVAVALTGVSFGVFADAAGFDLPRIVVMSALVFTGASQLAAVGVIGDGGSGGAAVGSALLLAARNTLYGPVVRRLLPDSLPARTGAAHLVIDETTAMAAAQTDHRDARGAFWFTGIVLWLTWNAGSIAGAVVGTVLGDPESWGLDAAFPAVFVALLAPHVRKSPGRAAALGGLAIALIAVPFSPPGVPILLSAIALVPALYVRNRCRRALAGEQQAEGPEAAP